MRLALHWQILVAMVLGAGIGLLLNGTVSTVEHSVTGEDLPSDAQALKVVALDFKDSTDRIEIAVKSADGSEQRFIVDGTSQAAGAFVTLKELQAKQPQAYGWFKRYGRSSARWVGDVSQKLGGLFLRLLQMVAIPLIITSLITGVLGLGDAQRLGKMFDRTLLYYVCTSMLAIVTGLFLVNLVRPGLNSEIEQVAEAAPQAQVRLADVLFEQLETLIPTNPIQAAASGSFLSIISFSLAFAIFTLLVGGKTADTLRDFFRSLFEVMMAMTMAIIKLAPAGVLFLMLYATATQGPQVFVSLGWYMLTVLLALMVHSCIVLPLILKFVARRNPWEFAQAMSPALLTAFSSASSNGTLPLTMANVEKRAGVNSRVSSFVLPLGATINMDGTALYEAIAVLFIAQLHHGVNLPLSQQIIVAITALLASVGAAGIPHAGLVMMVIILQAVGLPVEMQGIILAVDRVLDMCRTSVNVWSDSCGCAVVDRFEAANPS
ncbi:MAG: dicarboxylate/amino acid:cation symporter [Pirellulaceae bacterium]